MEEQLQGVVKEQQSKLARLERIVSAQQKHIDDQESRLSNLCNLLVTLLDKQNANNSKDDKILSLSTPDLMTPSRKSIDGEESNFETTEVPENSYSLFLSLLQTKLFSLFLYKMMSVTERLNEVTRKRDIHRLNTTVIDDNLPQTFTEKSPPTYCRVRLIFYFHEKMFIGIL
jgi:hypothetical protein